MTATAALVAALVLVTLCRPRSGRSTVESSLPPVPHAGHDKPLRAAVASSLLTGSLRGAGLAAGFLLLWAGGGLVR